MVKTLAKISPNVEGTRDRESRRILVDEASNELIFAVVGHAGSGTSDVSIQLKSLLKQTSVDGVLFDVEILKARVEIENWAIKKGLTLPEITIPPSLEQVAAFQDFGDQMRSEKKSSGQEDHAAVAKALAMRIRETRAGKTKVEAVPGAQVKPDQKPRSLSENRLTVCFSEKYFGNFGR